jgi:hypothetical protein
MKVKELYKILEKCEPEVDVYFQIDFDAVENPVDIDGEIVPVCEVYETSVKTEKGSKPLRIVLTSTEGEKE